jgi:hypothetical protein
MAGLTARARSGKLARSTPANASGKLKSAPTLFPSARRHSQRPVPSGETVMRLRYAVVLASALLASTTAQAASVTVELNTVETADNRCRLTFVIENKSKDALESLKLDLAVFNPQRIVQRRLATELGPVRAGKTIVKTFALDGACGEIGSVLVNDITCAPNAEACLDTVDLSSRVKDVRLYK